MHKLNLSLDDLHVESFTTSDGAGPRGTVQGHQYDTAVLTCHLTGGCCGSESDGYGTCNCPTRDGCQRPSTSCEYNQTVGEYSCYCLYARTDARACCSGAGCSGMC
jgi:hypothetical protein